MTPELRRYFLLTYAITWAFTTPLVIGWHTVLEQALSPWLLLFLPGPFGPTIAALVLTARRGGAGAVRELLRGLLAWRVSPIWYAFALLVPISTVAVAVAVSPFRGALADLDPLAGLSVAPLALVVALPFGPLAEELGWRGFALPRLLETGGLLKGSLILGVAWTFWHLPMFWFPGAALPSYLEPGAGSVALYLAQITAEACLMTGLFVVTRGSVLLAVLYHASFNTADVVLYSMLPEPDRDQELQVYVIGIVVSWVVALGFLGWVRRMPRGG